ncbi:SusC/RagA family TonB-linked outer membrane protein [Pseudozobellia thermophila]|uniref:TonB-linked outer membrane protein, SusC/RagA family n=1 Tax=Pseudozobellia thermophila TaxID=192903 RepID=A0A1M6LFG7_9FLAO|nr:TonB-dependent receptor [Pseudozobellia thermophila]SHJ69937.1 TonB-linked outer membrane protein, SusC/RagA family [Pseudozobellia thermophila]
MEKKTLFFILVKNILNKNRTVKISLLLFAFALFNLHANSYSQNKKVSLTADNETIESVLKKIEDQSRFRFFYKIGKLDVSKRVSLNIDSRPIKEVLPLLFNGEVTYTLIKNQIVLKPKHGNGTIQTVGPSIVREEQQMVSGTVTDRSGLPLAGANVIEKGTTNGVTTDFDGNFSLEPTSDDAVLVISYIGFATKEVQLNGETTINVQLEESASGLEEVVVVGFGTQKKVNVIGSVSQVSSDDIENRPVTQVSQAITGQMPGVTVIQRSGRPGESSGNISVRGVGSFGATPDALVLIDGIAGTMNDINPDDIQSISVLKDASSAAIYGARSANGVILITTKNGNEGKFSVSYNSYVGFNRATELPEFVDSWEYAEMYNIASGSNSFSAEDIAKYRAQDDPDNYPNTRFLEDLFSKQGVQTSHTLTLNGGDERNKYYVSAGILEQDGIVPKNSFSRYNVRMNLQNKLGDKFELSTRMFGAIEERNEPQATANKGSAANSFQEQLIQNAVRYPAVYLGQASNGDYGIGPESGGTPTSWLASESYLVNPRTKAGVNMKLDYRPNDNLVFSAIGGYNFSLFEQRSYLASQRLNEDVLLAQSQLDQFSNKEIFKTLQFTGEYSKEFGSHDFSLLVGYSFENEELSFFNGYRQDFPSNDYTVLDLGSAENQQSGGYDAEWALQSFFSRLKYSFDQKYLFEATLRYDGSSRFPESNKYAVFPAAALGWRVSQESFMQDIPWISNLKLKASWGILGNQNIGNYPYQTVLASGRDYSLGGGLSTGAAYATYTDENIKWESTETTDVGFESGFFDGKLTFNATYFHRNTTDVLFKPSSSVSTVLGVGISETNTGAVKNTGWEFDMGHRNTKGDFGYSINGNFSIIENEVVTLGLGNVEQPNGFVGNGSDLFIGYPMQMYYGYKTDGVFLNDAEVGDWPDMSAVNPTAQAGDLRYRDISGPDGVPDGQVDPTYDRTYLGSRIPKYTYGANINLNYKNFDFSLFLQGVGGVKGNLTGYAGYAFFNLGNIQRWQMEGRFDPENPVRYPDYPRLEVITNSGTANTTVSDFWVIDSGYLRVKNVQLGYKIPDKTADVIGVDHLRFYVGAENLHSFNSYRTGWDPEINSGGSYYPILATYTFGVNLKF